MRYTIMVISQTYRDITSRNNSHKYNSFKQSNEENKNRSKQVKNQSLNQIYDNDLFTIIQRNYFIKNRQNIHTTII